ncbi:MAG TPA: XrtA system polysaccharide deacetylase [Candidatus Cybelea sp.]|nr:XrtA system polysaccharide deacetylase [Candidatus Cybelea sp.]
MTAHAPIPAGSSGPVVNAMSVDVEDYFQVQAFADRFDREDWPKQECRVERNVDAILQMLGDAGARGTFFTLGWIAERYKPMVRRIVAAGHELASHGLAHYRADEQSPEQFRDDVLRARMLLEDIGGTAVKGYRAASFSVGARNLWAHEVLAEAGYRYSSSIYPIRHDLYGMPDAPRFAYRPAGPNDFVECPVTTVELFGQKLPCGGGGYFRLLPYALSRSLMRRVNRVDGRPCIFYFHPWEIDPDQPRQNGVSFRTRFRHYTNLRKMRGRLNRLLSDFAWDRMDTVFLGEGASR